MVHNQSNRALLKPGLYRHFKGKEYEVIGVAKDSENIKEYVVYRALYGDNQLWIRPLEMFLESVTIEGKATLRFEYIGPFLDESTADRY